MFVILFVFLSLVPVTCSICDVDHFYSDCFDCFLSFYCHEVSYCLNVGDYFLLNPDLHPWVHRHYHCRCYHQGFVSSVMDLVHSFLVVFSLFRALACNSLVLLELQLGATHWINCLSLLSLMCPINFLIHISILFYTTLLRADSLS